MTSNYTLLYSTFRRRSAEDYMAKNSHIANMVLWLNGSGEWQVRCYEETQNA